MLAHKGYLYHKTGKHLISWYWRCDRYPERSTRATTTGEPPQPPAVKKVGKHELAPDQDKIAAKKVLNEMKSTAARHPEMMPANIIRAGLSNVGDEVLPRLPERPAIKRALNRTRQAELPRNPQTLAEVRDVPDEYRKTMSGKPNRRIHLQAIGSVPFVALKISKKITSVLFKIPKQCQNRTAPSQMPKSNVA